MGTTAATTAATTTATTTATTAATRTGRAAAIGGMVGTATATKPTAVATITTLATRVATMAMAKEDHSGSQQRRVRKASRKDEEKERNDSEVGLGVHACGFRSVLTVRRKLRKRASRASACQ